MRGFSGVTKLRRKLRNMEPAMTDGVRAEISLVARQVETAMLGMVPVDEGDLASVIAHKLGRDGLTAVIGPGAGSVQIKKGLGLSKQTYKKDGNLTAATVRNNFTRLQLYKANWIEFGTKSGKPGSHSQPARPFIQPAFDINKDRFKRNVRRAVAQAINEAAQ